MSGRFFVHTFGCQMNVHDSDRMKDVLVAHGWTAAPSVAAADLVVFNTCSVRETAENKLRIEVDKLRPVKRARPSLLIAVAGCVAQQEGERLLKEMPAIDLVIGPDNIPELPALLGDQLGGAPPLSRTVFDVEAPRFLAAAPRPGQAPISAYVTTMKGCDERCSFCVVPYTRGPERYRPADEIVAEVQRWVAAGAREILLLGQTVDSYRDPTLPPPVSDDPDESQFPFLLRRLAAEVPDLHRLRYTSPHPRHATESLCAAHAELPVLCRHVHLPVQSGSDRVLKRMIRRYTRAEFLRRAERLRVARPGLTLSTDLIVGFPGETEEDFLATLSLVREAGFTTAFTYKYSVRPHTPARRLADDVPEEVKAERLLRLIEVVEEQGTAYLRGLVGSATQVLIEGRSKRAARGETPTGDIYHGRSERNEVVHVEFPAFAAPIGDTVEVTITRAHKHSLVGELSASVRARYVQAAAPLSPPPAAAVRHLPVVG